MAIPHEVKETDVRCPLEGCQFYSTENGWYKWRGVIDTQISVVIEDMRMLKKIGLCVVGAVIFQVFIAVWSILIGK